MNVKVKPPLLLNWYDKNAREMPWRISPSDRIAGVTPDPYHVWLSEIMLQQTTVATVKSYFNKFISTKFYHIYYTFSPSYWFFYLID